MAASLEDSGNTVPFLSLKSLVLFPSWFPNSPKVSPVNLSSCGTLVTMSKIDETTICKKNEQEMWNDESTCDFLTKHERKLNKIH